MFAGTYLKADLQQLFPTALMLRNDRLNRNEGDALVAITTFFFLAFLNVPDLRLLNSLLLGESLCLTHSYIATNSDVYIYLEDVAFIRNFMDASQRTERI